MYARRLFPHASKVAWAEERTKLANMQAVRDSEALIRVEKQRHLSELERLEKQAAEARAAIATNVAPPMSI